MNIVKYSSLILILSLITRSGLAQHIDVDRKVTYEATAVTLAETFSTLKEQADIPLAYNNALLNETQYSWEFLERPVSEILKEVTRKAGLSFEIKSAYILIRKKDTDQVVTVNRGKVLKGKVVDSSSGDPLAFATVRIKGTSRGMVTNEVGEFLLKLKANDEPFFLEFSYLGYHHQEVSVSVFEDEQVLISLEQDIVALEGVEVTPLDPLDILQEALDRVAENYPTEPFGYDAYYRELVKVDDAFVKYADAATYVYNSGYTRKDSSQFIPSVTANDHVLPFPEATGLLYGQMHSKQVKGH